MELGKPCALFRRNILFDYCHVFQSEPASVLLECFSKAAEEDRFGR